MDDETIGRSDSSDRMEDRQTGAHMLTPHEKERYSRQMLVEEIGEKGQERLQFAKVFIAGAGGLGSPVSIYLAAAGVGEIRIADNDRVELSNLNRQVLHLETDVGRLKVDSAREKLSVQNPAVTVTPVAETLTEANTADLAAGCQVIVDALDSVGTRLLLNQAALRLGIPLVHGAVRGFEGRAMTVVPGAGACLRCLYRGPVATETFPVLGTTPAVIGAVQATEAVKWIVGAGDLLIGRLLVFDGLAMTFKTFRVKRRPECPHCGSR